MFKDRYEHKLSLSQAWPKITNRLANIWLDFKLLLLSWVSLVPSHQFRLLCYKLAGVSIGHESKIHIGCRFYNPSGVRIGEDTIIGDHAVLDGRAALTIGSHVALASEVLIYNSEHNIHSDAFEPIEQPVSIGDYVFIGPRAIILPGVTIGKGAVVGAGAVVTHDIPQYSIAAGMPAKVIRERKIHNPHYRLGRARLFQ